MDSRALMMRLIVAAMAFIASSAALAMSNRQSVVAPIDALASSRTSHVFTAELSDLPAGHAVDVGKPLELSLRSQTPAFVSILYVDSHGVLDVVQPALGLAGNFIDAGATLYFSGSTEEPWRARPPVGPATVYVIASAEPLASLRPTATASAGHYLVSAAEAPALIKRLSSELSGRPAGTAALRKIDLTVKLEKGAEYSANDIVQYFTQTTRSIDKPRLDIYINFAFNSADILPVSVKALDTWGRVLSDPLMTGQSFVIGGHTDDVGGLQYNEELSLRRAQAVRDYLVSRYNIASARLRIHGYGMTRPLADGVDDGSRAMNRRVDFERSSALK